MESERPELADDLLSGADAIAEFLGPRFSSRSVYHLHEKGAIPTFKLPGCATIFGRKSEFRAAFSKAFA